jgi:uncharacterized lipoprotein YddW (UPF0748 family)
MKIVANILVIGLFFLTCTNYNQPVPTLDTLLQEDLRGVWLTNIDSEILFDSNRTKEALTKLKNSGFNTVYPVVWNDGYTLYPSELMRREFGEAFEQDTLFASLGIDPLQNVITHARALNLKVIPWFEFGFSSSYNQQGGHILASKPEWAARNQEGGILTKNGFEWMNALHPEVQQFLLNMVQEVISTYDVDGIQGDDRLPAMPSEGGYSRFTKELYVQETGNTVPEDPLAPAFLEWKADKLSQFAQDLYGTVKAYNEHLIVSLAPSVYPWSKQQYLQDWPQWLRDGSMDELIPQNYRWDVTAYQNTLNAIKAEYDQYKPADKTVRFASGIIIKAGNRFNDYSYVKQALQMNREAGVEGEVYFFYEGLYEQNGYLADSLKLNLYHQ